MKRDKVNTQVTIVSKDIRAYPNMPEIEFHIDEASFFPVLLDEKSLLCLSNI